MSQELQDKRVKYLKLYSQKLSLAVIPCRGKRPQITGWQKRGVPSPEELDEWCEKYPELNVGLVLGQASGFVGIDADGQAGMDRLKEISKGDLPNTWTFKTPGGGLRLLYRIPKGVSLKVRRNT